MIIHMIYSYVLVISVPTSNPPHTDERTPPSVPSVPSAPLSAHSAPQPPGNGAVILIIEFFSLVNYLIMISNWSYLYRAYGILTLLLRSVVRVGIDLVQHPWERVIRTPYESVKDGKRMQRGSLFLTRSRCLDLPRLHYLQGGRWSDRLKDLVRGTGEIMFVSKKNVYRIDNNVTVTW